MGDPAENAVDCVVTFKGYVFTLYDSHSEALHLGCLSSAELPFGKHAEMRERGETPPGEPPPEIADELQTMIDELVNHPVAAKTGIML